MRNKRLAVVAAVMGAVWFGGNAVRADALSVPNFSFEQVGSAGAIPDGSQVSADNSLAAPSNSTLIPGWTFSGAFPVTAGLVRDPSLQFSSSADGHQFAFLDTRTTNSQATLTISDPAGTMPTIQSGGAYTFTAAIGHEKAYAFGGTIELDLLANGVAVAKQSVLVDPIAVGSFVDESVTLSAATIQSLGLSGQQLSLGFLATHTTDASGGKNEVAIDNVRLTTTAAAPEPASLGVLGLGTLALLRKRRRQV